MRVRAGAAIAVLLVCLGFGGFGGPVQAVHGGGPDNGAHPYVGLIVFSDSSGTPTHRCTGTLISKRVLVTAGHCTAGAAAAQVWFDENVSAADGYPDAGGATGDPVTYPAFDLTEPDLGDVGLVLLDQAVNGRGKASVAPVDTLDSYATQYGDVTFDVVAFGLQEIYAGQLDERNRRTAQVTVTDLDDALGATAMTRGASTCFGGSGAPILTAGTNQIVAVTSSATSSGCSGGSTGYRLDVGAVAQWIDKYV